MDLAPSGACREPGESSVKGAASQITASHLQLAGFPRRPSPGDRVGGKHPELVGMNSPLNTWKFLLHTKRGSGIQK